MHVELVIKTFINAKKHTVNFPMGDSHINISDEGAKSSEILKETPKDVAHINFYL